jgi:hypothetical protein
MLAVCDRVAASKAKELSRSGIDTQARAVPQSLTEMVSEVERGEERLWKRDSKSMFALACGWWWWGLRFSPTLKHSLCHAFRLLYQSTFESKIDQKGSKFGASEMAIKN